MVASETENLGQPVGWILLDEQKHPSGRGKQQGKDAENEDNAPGHGPAN
jgi:hypothetical protein